MDTRIVFKAGFILIRNKFQKTIPPSPKLATKDHYQPRSGYINRNFLDQDQIDSKV